MNKEAAFWTFVIGLAVLAAISPEVRKAGKVLGLPVALVGGAMFIAGNAGTIKRYLA